MAAFDEKDYTKSFDWSIWKRLTPFVRPFRRDFVGMLVFNGLCALVDVAIPLFQRYAIRNFIQADSLQGITSPDGRVFGKMGHSERIGPALYRNVPGTYDMHLFASAVRYFKK